LGARLSRLDSWHIRKPQRNGTHTTRLLRRTENAEQVLLVRLDHIDAHDPPGLDLTCRMMPEAT
jgi:hypothetical protein